MVAFALAFNGDHFFAVNRDQRDPVRADFPPPRDVIAPGRQSPRHLRLKFGFRQFLFVKRIHGGGIHGVINQDLPDVAGLQIRFRVQRVRDPELIPRAARRDVVTLAHGVLHAVSHQADGI